MYEFENDSWNSKLEAQYDKAVEDLIDLLNAQDELRDQIEAQAAFIELLKSLLAPPE